MVSSFRARLTGAVVLSTLAITAACSTTSGDGAAASDEDLRLHPTGSETMSTLIVQLPTGTCMPGQACTRPLAAQPSVTLDGASMAIGGAGLRVLPGKHKLVVGPTQTTVTLDAGKTRTMTLPVVKRVCTNGGAAALPDTAFGRTPTLHYAACPTVATVDGTPLGGGVQLSTINMYSGASCGGTFLAQITPAYACQNLTKNSWTVTSVLNPATGQCSNVPPLEWQSFCFAFAAGNAAAIGLTPPFPDGNVAIVPGSYAFTVEAAGGNATDTRVVAEGDAKDLAFTLPQLGTIPSTWDTSLTFGDARELPDAAVGTISSNCERNYSIPATAKDTVDLKAFTFPECTYTLSVAGRTVALNQAAANNVTLHRVDMDDVTVTREDGTTFTTKGTYEIYFGGNRIAGPFNTNSGVDVLPGAYEVVVKYSTAEGPKTNTYDINL